MKNTKRCPKCSSQNIVRVPDNQNRHASGNNIYTSTFTLMKKSRLYAMSAVIADMWKIGWKHKENVTRSSAHLDNERRAAKWKTLSCKHTEYP